MQNMPIEYLRAPYDSPLYRQSLALREEVLRAPLGMRNRPEDTQHDHEQEHFVAVENGTVIATVTFDAAHAKLRQMAVAPALHGKGIGAALVGYVHREVSKSGGLTLALNARHSAIPFYEKLGYACVGEPFDEIGIPHHRMEQQL